MESNAIPMTSPWRKSSYSSDQGGECVEFAELAPHAIAVRDSKTPAGPVLTLDSASFTAFVGWAAHSG